jgi:hypothetical protein
MIPPSIGPSDEFAYTRGTALAAFETVTLSHELTYNFAFGISIGKDFDFATGFAQRYDGCSGSIRVQLPNPLVVDWLLRHTAMVKMKMTQIAQAFVRTHVHQNAIEFAPCNAGHLVSAL